MKLLTTIAAVLISISAYSQDLIEYDKGTFTQNGEQLSMEQIYDLTISYNTGIGDFRRGNRFDRLHKNGNLRSNINGLYFLGGTASGVVGVISLGSAYWLYSLGEDFAGRQATALGTGLCVVSYKAFSRKASSPEGCLKRRDKKFNKVADKINQAIHDSNQ